MGALPEIWNIVVAHCLPPFIHGFTTIWPFFDSGEVHCLLPFIGGLLAILAILNFGVARCLPPLFVAFHFFRSF